MSRGSDDMRAEALGKLARELRQSHALSASFFRVAAARSGMTVTDLEVIDLLESASPMTAGQLAELTGLTTGAITGMINRLEEAGLVSRESDPDDGRRVIVRLVAGNDEKRQIAPMFAALERAWNELALPYDDEQLAFLLEFLKQSNTLTRKELARLQEAPDDEEKTFSAALAGLTSGQLVISGAARLNIRADESMAELYRASFEGPGPDVKAKEGVVTIRYPRRLWMVSSTPRSAEIKLSVAVPWQIVIQGGVSEIHANLDGLDLASLVVKGGMNMVHLDLPVPSRVATLLVSGGASTIDIRRPAGVPAQVHLKGWVSTFIFDDQTFGDMGNDVRLHSPGYEGTAPGYDIEVSSSASMVTITSG